MTQLLISVTSVDEAQIALENGADIIDLKDPHTGALGALPLSTIRSVVAYVHACSVANVLTSATIGDLPMQSDLIVEHVLRLVNTGVDIVKIGFFETENYQPCLDALKLLTNTGAKLMAVLFAEYEYPVPLIEAIKEAGFIGVMLDTAKKNGLTLIDHYAEGRRMSFSEQVLTIGLSFGLAGSLRLQHIDAVKEMNPTYIGFRGGVCAENQRELCLDAAKIMAIRNVM